MGTYDITYRCGHAGTVYLVGPHRARESRLQYLASGNCVDCYRRQSTQVAQEQAHEMELPVLVGSEKQIAWAETLRVRQLTEIEAWVETQEKNPNYQKILQAVEHISCETSAKQWIEWRYDSPSRIINEVWKKLLAMPTQEQVQAAREAKERAEAIARAAQVEATIRPESPLSEVPAEIQVNGTTVSVQFPEQDETFRNTIKALRYSWKSGRWERVIGKFAGNPVDRAVELGCRLLASGFLVRVFDADLRARIVAGEYEPEQTRWITVFLEGEYVGWLKIQWNRQTEDYYHAAKQVRGSRYSAPCVVVPVREFEQVLDFADRYDFRLSDGAKQAIAQARADKEQMLVVSRVTPQPSQERTVIGDKPPVLKVPTSVEIDDELKDAG